MNNDHTVKTSININAPIEKVWNALTNPAIIKQYMYDTEVTSNWQKDKPISFKGVWQGKAYEDKAIITRIEPPTVLEYAHWSNLSGKPNTPENQNVVTMILSDQHGSTHLAVTQSNNATPEARDHSKTMWDNMLTMMKNIVEGS